MVDDSLKPLKRCSFASIAGSGQPQVESCRSLWDYQHLSVSVTFSTLLWTVQVFIIRMRKISPLSLIREDNPSQRMVLGGQANDIEAKGQETIQNK